MCPHTLPFTGSSSSARASVSNMTGGEASKLPSFWIPELTPQAKEAEIKKPVSVCVCVCVHMCMCVCMVVSHEQARPPGGAQVRRYICT